MAMTSLPKRFQSIVCTLSAVLLTGCAPIDPESAASSDSSVPVSSVSPSSDASTIQSEEWRQENFILSSFFAVGGSGSRIQYRSWLSRTKAAGIDIVELTFLPRSALLTAVEVCEELQLSCIVQDLDQAGGIGGNYQFTEEAVQSFTELMQPYQCVEGYFVWDEPARETFEKAQELRKLYKKYDPSRLAYSCVYPSYGVYNWTGSQIDWSNSAYARYIDDYLSAVEPEVLSLNYYPFAVSGSDASLKQNDLWRDMGYVRKRAMEEGLPYWHYFQGVGDLQDKVIGAMTLEKIQVQMYAALAYGVKGLSYYTSYGLLLDADGYETDLYEPLTALNGKVKNIGGYLFDKEPEALYHSGLSSEMEAAYFLDAAGESSLIAGMPENLIIGLFRQGDVRVLVAVNKDYRSAVSGDLMLREKKKVGIFDSSTGAAVSGSDPTDRIPLELPAGECAVYILE